MHNQEENLRRTQHAPKITSQAAWGLTNVSDGINSLQVWLAAWGSDEELEAPSMHLSARGAVGGPQSAPRFLQLPPHLPSGFPRAQLQS